MSLGTASAAPLSPTPRVIVSDEEWRLLRELREIPASPLRERMMDVIEALVAFVGSPGCAEIQADGVPCQTASADCERCALVTGMLDELRARVRQG